MPPTCHICMDKVINNNTRCKTCKKCLCIECYDRVSTFLNVKNKEVLCKYKCPFCNTEETQPLEDLSTDILIRFAETAVLNYTAQVQKIEELTEENEEIKSEFDDILMQIRSLEMQENKDRRDAMKYRQLRKQMQEVKQVGRKTIKFSEIEKMI